MRKIKFRCWDKDFKEYSSYHLNRTNVNDIKECERFVFEQFTGLTDINEKEIYEGDILKWTGTTGDNEGVEFKNVVYFLSYRYRIKGTRNKKTFHSDLNINQIFNHKCEVIGNIHQNKNLLT